MTSGFDALLWVSFGGPERPEDLPAFLRVVTKGRNVPESRLKEVEHQYMACGGRSPLNDHNRRMIDAIRARMTQGGLRLPVYFGNRCWHPFLKDAVRKMRDDGVTRALAFVTSPFSSYSGCRQYREAIEAAQHEIGPDAPEIIKIRPFFNHPGFIEAVTEQVRQSASDALANPGSHLVFTAHSIPQRMAAHCDYESQLREASRLVALNLGDRRWDLVFQSRSGPPSVPWLEPDVQTWIGTLRRSDMDTLIAVPIGFVSDHMEVVWDLDHAARAAAQRRGLRFLRVPTAGSHPAFIDMIYELIQEQLRGDKPSAIGAFPPKHSPCPPNCCPE